MDCGATALMSGSDTIKDYLADAHSKVNPLDELKIHRYRRQVRLGCSKDENALWCGVAPASFKMRKETPYIYFAPGRTPVQPPASIFKEVKVRMDYAP